MSAFNAWIFLKGLETLKVRMAAHSANALQLAQWLEQQPNVSRVFYPGQPSHPQYELAMMSQQKSGGRHQRRLNPHRSGARSGGGYTE
jgi:O-succinylhomoserine sulfhydrylase